ncbi:MAG: putative lipid II flippase FtsW [Myxococcota bacterium]
METTAPPAPEKRQALAPEIRAAIRRVAPYDFPLLAAVVLLLGMGAVMVYSATINEMTLLNGDGMAKLKTHLTHLGLGILAMLGATFFPYKKLRRITYPALFVTVIVLGLVIVAGVSAGNARRWLALPGFNFQPAELAKLVFVLFLAHSITKKGGNIRKFTVAFIPHFLVCSMLILLCLFQPDFGTSVVLVILMFTLLFVAGTRISYVALFIFVGGFLAFQAIASNDMRLGRVLAAIDPWAHRLGRGYQMVNSQIAIGSGGFSGQGLGFGGQTLTGHLPEGETDFILSVLGEQLGSIGIMFIAFLFGLILVRGIRIATRCEDAFGRFLAFGITLLLVLEAVINMLVAVALIPTKGLTLPFVSYGGSSMLISCAAVGVLLNISRSQDWASARQTLPVIEELETVIAPVESGPTRPRVQVPTTRWQRLSARFKKKKPQSIDEVIK